MKPKTIIVDVGLDFSQKPQGRFYSNGSSSAEALFIQINDTLEHCDHVNVEFNDFLQVESSFLGHLAGLIINNHLKDKVTVSSNDEWVTRRYYKYYGDYYEQWRYNL